jgi:hypothetical protein
VGGNTACAFKVLLCQAEAFVSGCFIIVLKLTSARIHFLIVIVIVTVHMPACYLVRQSPLPLSRHF